MNVGRTIFAQILDFVPRHEFRRCVDKYAGNRRVRTFSCWDQFLCLLFAQLTYRESLRDIEACLRALDTKLYHMGIRGRVSRNTLAVANEKRDWRIYAEFAHVLIGHARELYAGDTWSVELQDTVYALDSSTIDLCLNLFPWARFRTRKGAIKLHTLLDLRGNIPVFVHISDGKMHDVRVLDVLVPEPGAIYILDRGYIDFERLWRLHEAQALFVVRAKGNLNFRRRYSRPVDRSSGLFCDQTIVLTGRDSAEAYPAALRRVRFRDLETGKDITVVTNNFALSADTIAKLYRARWQIELFFKWIKQHLRIKAFYGNSANAVKTQIWVAISAYVLIAILRKRLEIERDLYTLLQILSVTLFEKVPVAEALAATDYNLKDGDIRNQLELFNL
jgi:hypothetical protein